MARITVEDCQRRVDNRFLLVQMAIKRVRQFREGYAPLVDSMIKEVVTALREIAAGKLHALVICLVRAVDRLNAADRNFTLGNCSAQLQGQVSRQNIILVLGFLRC